MFDNLHGLKRLEIIYSYFDHISENVLQRLYNLEYLFILESDFTSHLTFSRMPHLKALFLDNFSWSQLDLSTLPSLSLLSFKYIDSEDEVANKSEYLRNLKHSNLKALKIEKCKFPNFDTTVLSGFTALQILRIESSEIESITFGENLSNLHTLVLNYIENFKTLDSSISVLKGLKSLVLTSNRLLNSAPNMFMGLDNLEHLVFLNCRDFDEIHMDMLSGLPNLVELNISHCYLNYIHSKAFSHTPKLIKLNLSCNRLNYKIIDDYVFWDLTNLKELDLSNNNLEYCEIRMFSYLTNLEVLDLRYNKIDRYVSKDFKKRTNFRVLNIGW